MFIDKNLKKTYQSILLIDYVSQNKVTTILNGDDRFLEELFIELMSKNLLQIEGVTYKPTIEGNEVFSKFMKRYEEYLKLYDIFGYVDLEKGEFAFEKFYDFDNDDEWNAYKISTRFQDLRLAVAQFKKINPSEIVFMSFINENRFDTKKAGWQVDLVSEQIWDEIEDICKTSIQPDQLGDDAMSDMIEQGSKMLVQLLKKDTELKKQATVIVDDDNNEEDEYVEEIEYYEETYCYDPFYVSPFWLIPLILW